MASSSEGGYRKVVVFGPSGAGKSSLINLLTDGVFHIGTGGEALGTTFETQLYSVPERNVELYDTAGLNEVDSGMVNGAESIEQLINLLRSLEDGVCLFVMVKQKAGGSILECDRRNYEIFIKEMGMAQIPSVLVVTGCEHEDDMTDWAPRNWEHFTKAGMNFSAVVSGTCLTTGPFRDTAVMIRRRQETKDAVWGAVDRVIAKDPIKIYDEYTFIKVLRAVWNSFVRYIPGMEMLFWVNDKIEGLLLRMGLAKEKARRIASMF